MDSKYVVPVITHNLHKQETIVQIAEVLDHLANVSEGIFAQINKRLELNRAKLSDISGRVDVVNKKINKLRGAKKATQVFSSSKYPASDVYKEYVSTFSDAPPIEIKRHPVKYKSVPAAQGPLEKLQFFHVNIHKPNDIKLHGLGDAPRSIEFVNDLLLYNSGTNLYKDFVTDHASNTPQQITIVEENESEIGAAPKSISERSIQSKTQKQSYFYTPQIGEVPTLDVPLDLPDLPGIANDLHYDNELNSSIAPSADITPSIFELDFHTSQNLPTIPQDDEEDKEPNISIAELPPVPEIHVPDASPSTPNVPSVVEEKKPVDIQLVEEPKSSIEKAPAKSSATTAALPPADDLRSSLMEAIRNAGGSGKAKLKTVDKNNGQPVTKGAQGGDLMTDLHNKLFMRRKGISGAKQSQENGIDADSTLSRIAAMIPPPEPSNDPDSTSNDEEWEE
ncbi:unnamed protein product [Phyllotreta striolata]|uniref:WH2 domain-containing protein n=1 Tax=Phyllotreta striolata TaxID=444603 RepID=A0A9N9XKQ2_PHYSR|nr:unnamed protein product [Phyllotreta striolata]